MKQDHFSPWEDTVGATPLVDSGWHNLLMWAQKLQSGRLTHFVDQQTCCCVGRIPTYTLLFLQFQVTPFVDSGPTTNQQSVRSTNFVDVDDFSSNQHSWWSTNFVDLLLTQNQQYLSTGQTWPSRQTDWLLLKTIFWMVKKMLWICWVPDPKTGLPNS